jgi:protein TonB
MTCLEKIIDYGNAYYPKAEHGKLYGNIVITFEILSDGHIRAPEVGRSSGHPVLDNFTIRAMRSASPCAPFTDEIRELADIVVVMKTLSYTHKESDIEAKDQPVAQINSVQ